MSTKMASDNKRKSIDKNFFDKKFPASWNPYLIKFPFEHTQIQNQLRELLIQTTNTAQNRASLDSELLLSTVEAFLDGRDDMGGCDFLKGNNYWIEKTQERLIWKILEKHKTVFWNCGKNWGNWKNNFGEKTIFFSGLEIFSSLKIEKTNNHSQSPFIKKNVLFNFSKIKNWIF